MSKKAEIKIAVRRVLEIKTDQTCSLARPDICTASLYFGTRGYHFTFSEFDDAGDPATDVQYNEIYDDLQVIVDEHNQNVL